MAIQHHPPKRRMLPRGKRRPQLSGRAGVSEICVEGYPRAIAFYANRSYREGMPTVAHIRGSVGGAVILTLFGSLWCILALAGWRARPGWSIPAGSVVTITLLALCVTQLMASRNIPSINDPVAAAKGKRAGMLFGIIFGLEGGLIALCSTLLARYGLSIWIPIAAAVIVGVHFIPLARVFDVPLYYWTGVLSVLGMLGCSLVHDAATRVLCAGLVMAAVLWLTVILLLLQTRSSWPRELRFETAKVIGPGLPGKDPQPYFRVS